MKTETDPIYIAIIVCATAVIAAGSLILFGSNGGLQAALLALFIVPCMIISFKNPRWGLLALLIYLPFGNTIAFSWVKVHRVIGNVIKYTNAYPLYKLAKDGFYFPALLGILTSTSTFKELHPKIKPLLIAIAVLVGSCLLTLLFVNLPEKELLKALSGSKLLGYIPLKDLIGYIPLKGLIGFKILLGYIPLILCGYYLIRQKEDLFFVTRLLVVLIIVSCSLCFLQYFLLLGGICPDNTILNQLPSLVPLSETKYYPNITDKTTLKALCLVGGSLLYNPQQDLIRLPGTFSDPWQWAWFLISSSFITFAASFSDPSRRWRLVSWLGMGMVLGATFISGQRAALLLVPIIFLVLLIVSEKHKQWLPIKLAIIAALAFLSITQISFIQEQINNLIVRWQYSPPLNFMTKQLSWLMGQHEKNFNLFGLGGLGSATSGTRRLVDADGIELIEIFYAKLIYEIGILGFIAFLGTVTVLTVLTFRAYRNLKNPALRHWGICLWIFVLFISYNPWYYPLTVEPVAVYYWLFAGILLKLPELDSKQ